MIKLSLTRRAAFAVRALSIELAQVTDMAHKPEIALMRYQFWSDLIDEIYENPSIGRYRGQPVATELQYVLQKSIESESKKSTEPVSKKPPMSKSWLKRLVESRRGVMKRSASNQLPFSNVDEMQNYADFSVGSIYYWLIEHALAEQGGIVLVDDGDDEEAEPAAQPLHQKMARMKKHDFHMKLDHVASHLGKAQGIANLIRGLEINARKFNTCFIPQDLLLKHSVSQEDILRWDPDNSQIRSSIRDICFDMAIIGNEHLRKTRIILKEHIHDKDHKRLFIPLIPIDMFYMRLQRMNFDPFELKLASVRRDAFLPLKIWFKSRYM
jgi:NADH dehydrogenase [ubiquinone] 1 alpha subcomplex assembly factor 6